MRKPSEIYVVLFLQSMVRFRAWNFGFTTKLLLGIELPGLAWTCLDLPGGLEVPGGAWRPADAWRCLETWRCLEMHRAAEYGIWFGHGMDLVEA